MQSLSIFVVSLLVTASSFAATTQWTETDANQWQQKQGWILGANYINADSINQLEMWQPETFNPAQMDRELAYAEQLGFKTLRVFLHDLAWQADSAGFSQRIDTFLTLASKHGIRPMFVLFDSCWNASPHLGLQPTPTPGVHNSGWVQSPGVKALIDPKQVPRLKAYVTGVVSRFAKDPRILAWDLWNEPDNLNSGNDLPPKVDIVEQLLPQVFAWARSADPTQPLTSAVWNGEWSTPTTVRPIEKIQLENSDIITFHNYDPADVFVTKVQSLRRLHRPIICTEYMARPRGSTFQTILPILKSEGVSGFNWGFINGKSQTIYPWDSWQQPYSAPPLIWFHDILQPDGTPFDASEVKLIKSMTTL